MPAGSVIDTPRKSIFGTNLRWSVCGLLFFATTVNYVDRQVLGILKPVLEHDLHWNEDGLQQRGFHLPARLHADDAVGRLR